MDSKGIAIVSATALLALTATASAGPMTIASTQIITPPIQIEQAHYYYRHHYRHYGWHRGWRHYGWHRATMLTAMATLILMAMDMEPD